jgi:hypothetical protein
MTELTNLVEPAVLEAYDFSPSRQYSSQCVKAADGRQE